MGETPKKSTRDDTLLSFHDTAIAGAVAGALTAIVANPLDVARTRAQVQPTTKGAVPHYRGLTRTLLLLVQEGGPFVFFRGIGPQLLGLVPSWAVYFTAYDHLKQYLTIRYKDKEEGAPDPAWVHLVAAIGAGSVNNLATTPFFTVKTRLQTQMPILTRGLITKRPLKYNGTLDCFLQIVRKEGPLTLWSGFVPSMIGLIHVAIQFPLYEMFKVMVAYRKNNPSEVLNVKEILACAAASKIVASSIAYPHESLRSRLQEQSHKAIQEKKYIGVFDCAKKLMKQEGFGAVYQGLQLTLLRTVPASMITLTTYEYTLRYLKERRKLSND